ACNQIMFLIAVLAVPGLAVVVARVLQQGFIPIAGVFAVLAAILAAVIVRRRRLSLGVRAATVTAIPFIIGVTSVVWSGHISATLMFFVSSGVLAGCFFGRRAAYAVVVAAVALLIATFFAFRSGVITPSPVNDAYALSVVTWCSI